MPQTVTTEMRKHGRIGLTFQHDLIIAITNNPAKCFVESSLMLRLTKSIDENEISVGQTLEGGLVGLGSLAGDGHNLVVGIVPANLLELVILRSAELGGSSSEGLGQLDGTILSIDGDSSHGDYLFLSDSLGSLFFISEGFVPFVVITV